jgi:hypothetical protein
VLPRGDATPLRVTAVGVLCTRTMWPSSDKRRFLINVSTVNQTMMAVVQNWQTGAGQAR